MDFLTLDKNFVLDNFNFVQDKNFFVRADGRGNSSNTKLIGLNLHVSEHGKGYSNLTPDPKGARGAPGVKIQVSPNQKTLLTKVVTYDKGMKKISSAPPEELGKPAKQVS